MPEGDTIFRTAGTLTRALAGQTVTRFETVLPKLARIDCDTPLAGRTVERVESRGKWLLMHFSGDLILLTHMLMSGSWHIYRPGEKWQRHRSHMRIVVETAAMLAVAFDVPVAEFHSARSLGRRAGFNRLGPAPLAADFLPAVAVANLAARPHLELGPALLDQTVLAGLGNVFKSEVAFACGLNPFRKVATLTAEQLARLVATARQFLLANVTPSSGHRRSTTGSTQKEENLWVYGREGLPCRRCATPIRSQKHATDGRVSFWCPTCQENQENQGQPPYFRRTLPEIG
jgi:endonuclease-8